ncbi:hypothetical protein [Curtobacterium sp. DN_7.5]|uniref:hypothetical protein n=1 Tax=Curtobacterium sp. DN_7.5 TaxID=3049047 RepID=UPI001F58A602|nr:hypothetical protein [Curtobacterium sp. DN_7.5]
MGHRTNSTVAIGVLLLVTTALAGCAQQGPAGQGSPTATTSAGGQPTATADAATSSPTTSPTPRPTSTITPVPGVDDDAGNLPDSCTGLITAGKWDDSFASAPLNDPSSVGDPAEVPKDALTPVLQPDGKSLYCVWRDPGADTTNLSIRVATVDSAKAYPHLESALQGYDCTLDGYGYRCQKVSKNSQYPVTDGDTYYTRGDVGIHIRQSNVTTSGLLDDVIAHVF